MDNNQIMSAVFLVAVLALVLPGFLSNNRMKQFMKNLSIWAIIILIIIVIISLI